MHYYSWRVANTAECPLEGWSSGVLTKTEKELTRHTQYSCLSAVGDSSRVKNEEDKKNKKARTTTCSNYCTRNPLILFFPSMHARIRFSFCCGEHFIIIITFLKICFRSRVTFWMKKGVTYGGVLMRGFLSAVPVPINRRYF